MSDVCHVHQQDIICSWSASQQLVRQMWLDIATCSACSSMMIEIALCLVAMIWCVIFEPSSIAAHWDANVHTCFHKPHCTCMPLFVTCVDIKGIFASFGFEMCLVMAAWFWVEQAEDVPLRQWSQWTQTITDTSSWMETIHQKKSEQWMLTMATPSWSWQGQGCIFVRTTMNKWH